MKNHYFSYENFVLNEDNNQVNGIALIAVDEDIHKLKHNTFKLVKHNLKLLLTMNLK